MRRRQYTITAPAIHDHAAPPCQRHLPLPAPPPPSTPPPPPPPLLATLSHAAPRLPSLAPACGSLSAGPSDTAVRTALLATLPALHELQRRINRALHGDLPKAVRRRRQPLAIDLTLIPYHGEPL